MSNRSPVPQRAFAQPAFLVVSAILLVAAVTLLATVQQLKLHFKKEAVQQPKDFHALPVVMGGWLQISEDDKLDKETEDILGTDQYVYRDYIQVDTGGAFLLNYLARGEDKTGPATQPSVAADTGAIMSTYNGATFGQKVAMIQAALNGKTPHERKEITYGIEIEHPGSIIHLGLTYYTGLVDTVAHVPDRCYIADGYEPAGADEPTWTFTPGPSGKAQSPLQVRFISFEDQTGNNRVPKCVSYVFQTNGQYKCDPNDVRIVLQNLGERYGYYAKIELMVIGTYAQSPEERKTIATKAMTGFLSAARPEIETCFPDWDKLVKSQP